MKIIRTVQKMKEELSKAKHKSIGFIPTMGYLHEGHLSLVERARQENDVIVMSIFVNPLQFGPNEDFDSYPRNEEDDVNKAQVAGVDLLFIPTVSEMYPEEMGISMTIHQGANVLCGSKRPGHFDGVITVLTKLFHITQSTRAYFGLKDAQQFAIVTTLVDQLNFPIELVGLPTIRENDGLAKSSRNVYLDEKERKEATALYAALVQGAKLLVDGNKNPDSIIKEVKNYILHNTSGTVDYIEVLSFPRLHRVSVINEQIILAIAVHFKKARLIDNIIMNNNGEIIHEIRNGGRHNCFGQ